MINYLKNISVGILLPTPKFAILPLTFIIIFKTIECF